MASFNGFALGFIFSMPVAANPNAKQVNSYAGANGLEVLDMGSRGGTTVVEGAMVGVGTSGLAGAEAALRAMQVDGGAYVLVDTLGNSWPGVILIAFRPSGRVLPVASVIPNTFARRYTAEFLHIQ
jgi:hypothetical protein